MKRSIIVGGIAVIVVAGVATGMALRKPKGPIFDTVTVGRASLQQTVEATGSVTSAEELILSFKRQGRIQSVSVSVGDSVVAGQELAVVADATLTAEIARARATVESAQADLEKTIAGTTDEDIRVKGEAVQKARVDVSSAEVAVQNAESDQSIQTAAYLDTGIREMNDAAFVIQFTLDTIEDGILDNEADGTFRTTKTSSLVTADVQKGIAASNLATAREQLAIAASGPTVDNVLSSLYAFRAVLDTTSRALEAGFDALSGAIVTTDFSQATIDSLKASFNTRASAVATEGASMQTSISNLTTGLQTLRTAVDVKTSVLRAAEQALALSEAEYAALIAPPQEYTVRQKRASLAQATADLMSAESKRADARITAPIAGVITAIDRKVGETVAANESIIHLIGGNKLQIDVDIPESDIASVVIGEKASITLDAFGSDRSLGGLVSFIEPSERIVQDVVYYRVTVLFDQDPADVKPGMTADVTIAVAERDSVIAIPFRAVVSSNGDKTVRVLENNVPVSRTVTLGLRGDDGMVEILSGLSEGEIVITAERAS